MPKPETTKQPILTRDRMVSKSHERDTTPLYSPNVVCQTSCMHKSGRSTVRGFGLHALAGHCSAGQLKVGGWGSAGQISLAKVTPSYLTDTHCYQHLHLNSNQANVPLPPQYLDSYTFIMFVNTFHDCILFSRFV